ncbi:AGZA family xanthine/uracil permease-like MFS transporter [Melghirimyces profundicolus]|uniref:AGZA family xanthine/uracil permease-like MFS transporter n=1 Tax=Melghirimyces profundicolus TaxID=1242148 RepID=A0A2T6B0N4_9BACL|nr:NCS2 family permease [Melghirimyces profundicolus]PTX49617.1 AGZA family xanthine/uracil permease-like MFS transporter [Melghirimyces profundicolus]
MDRFFSFSEKGTNIRREVLAGLTTFLTMVYIVVVNPAILEKAGMDFGAVFVATVLASVISTLIMGLFANYPIAIAPGMGLNAYFAFSVVGQSKIGWETAMGAVLVAGILFLILSVTRFREGLINAIPSSLKFGITAGIGLFIAFIGLKSAGIIVGDEVNLVGLGDFHSPMTILSLCGLFVTLVLMTLRVPGALFLGMVLTALGAWMSGLFELPQRWVTLPPSMAPTFGAAVDSLPQVFEHGLYAVIFAFLLVTLFDTTGTMIGVAEQAGLTKDGKFPRMKSALLADAVGMTTGAVMGTSPTSAYIESSAGVAAGGRTGFTAVVVSLLLLGTLFFEPLVAQVAALPAITAPTLIIVGCFMMAGLAKVKWEDFDEAFPAFIVMLSMPLTFSIATGIAFGFITYPLLKLARGRGKDVHPLLYLFMVLFILQLAFLPE